MADKKPSTPKRSTPADKIKLPSRNASGPDPDSSLPEEKFYQLKTKAVDDLVTANAENSPPVSKEELRRYGKRSHLHLPVWLTAVLLKCWFAGVICYFLIWGVNFAINPWDHILVLGIALGLATNLLANNVFRFLEPTVGAYDPWMMFPKKGWIYLLPDVLYALLLIFCVIMTYNTVNVIGGKITGHPENVILSVGPILFGLFTCGWDLLFLGMKRLFLRILRDARNAK